MLEKEMFDEDMIEAEIAVYSEVIKEEMMVEDVMFEA
jgi:hypothetical protein